MGTWVWPFNLYCRIRRLEAENAALRTAYKDLDAKYRAEAIAHAIHSAAMISAFDAMAEEQLTRYKELTNALNQARNTSTLFSHPASNRLLDE